MKNLYFILVAFISGLLLPLSFAPFNYPLLALISLAIFYNNLQISSLKQGFVYGLFFGLGYFGLGVSWIFVSIHQYGHLNYGLSGTITLIFILYLSCFTGLLGYVYKLISPFPFSLASGLLFSALWVIFEWLRAHFLTGFPWLLLGFGQTNGPFKSFLPILGLYGISLIISLVAALLVVSFNQKFLTKLFCLTVIISLTLIANCLEKINWTHEQKKNPISVAVIQANLSMRDKWDEHVLWQLVKRYQKSIYQALGTDLIVLPESAIPIAGHYLQNFIDNLDDKARDNNSAILLGIPKEDNNLDYYNSMMSLGQARGWYLKQHLVPFGEFIPTVFAKPMQWLNIPEANLKPGLSLQSLVTVHGRPIAALICYELAYANLLRQQLPKAEWIVSISDDGWFGHSLAVYQHQQMAQALSRQTGRYQVLSNNDGLSSVIDTHGTIVKDLPFAQVSTLFSTIYPALGATPWVILGDMPIILLSFIIVLYYFFIAIILPYLLRLTLAANQKRRYPC